MQKHFPGKKVEEYRRMLGLFGVSGDLALQQVNTYIQGVQCESVAFSYISYIVMAKLNNFFLHVLEKLKSFRSAIAFRSFQSDIHFYVLVLLRDLIIKVVK